jgi:hypothetical protein
MEEEFIVRLHIVKRRVQVAVNQSWHDRLAASFDGHGCRSCVIDGIRADRGDLAISEQHIGAGLGLCAGAIDQRSTPNQQLFTHQKAP